MQNAKHFLVYTFMVLLLLNHSHVDLVEVFSMLIYRHKKPVGYDSISTVHCMVANQDDIISMSEEKMMLPEEPVIVSGMTCS